MAGKKLNMAPMWKKLMNNVDIDKPTSSLDNVYIWDAPQGNANPMKPSLNSAQKCSNHVFLLVQ